METIQKVRDLTSNEEVIVQPGPAVKPSEKVDFIRQGKKKKTITKFQQNKNVTYREQGDKIIVVEKEKAFDETGVARKKRNYVMYESILGTEKERDTTKITATKMRKPRPRVVERIVLKKKRKEILDNYQYHESKVIKEPQNASYVFHQRLSEPIGGSYETKTYERQVYRINDVNSGRPSSVQTRNRNQVYRPSSTQSRNRNTGYRPSSTISSTSNKNESSNLRQSSASNRNRPKINVSNTNTQTFNRRKNQPEQGQYSTLTASRNRRPILKAVTTETKFKKVSRNTNSRNDYENSNSQRGRLPNILKDTENTFPLKEVEKKEHFRNKSPENADIQGTVITIQKETKTETTQPINENDVTEYKKVLKKTITDNNGKTTTTTKTTIEKAGNERPKRRRFKH